MVAFWRYDQFPFVLGGHVTKLHNDGSVETTEYSCCIVPFKLLPVKAGEAELRKINTIRNEHDVAKRAFNKEWRDKLDEQLPWNGKIS